MCSWVLNTLFIKRQHLCWTVSHGHGFLENEGELLTMSQIISDILSSFHRDSLKSGALESDLE